MKIRTVALALAALAAAPFVLTLADAQEDDSADKSSFVRFVENTISTPDRRIELGAIDGALSSDVKLASITISDREGAWLRIEGVHLVWSRLALLKGKLDVDSLDAERIEMVRQPLPAATVEPAASEGFKVPELPVAVKIGRLSAPEVVLGAPVLGEETRLAVTAAASLADGSLAADLAVRRQDAKAGEVTLKAAYAAATKQLDIDLAAQEPAGGVMARLLKLPGQPAVGLSLKGAGPLDAFAADLHLATDGVDRLAGRTTIGRDGDGYRFASQLSGDLKPLVPPDYALYLDGASALDLAGRVADAGPINIDRLQLTAPVLTLKGAAALAADGFPTAINVDGRLAGSDGALRLGAPDAAASLGEASLHFEFGADNRWQLEFTGQNLATPAVRAESLALRGSGVAVDLADAAKRRVDFALTGGSRGLILSDAALAKAVGGELAFTGAGRWTAGAPLTIDELKLSTPTAAAAFSGQVQDGRIEGKERLVAASLAPFSGLAGRPLDGAVDVAAAGTLTPLTGAFDLSLDGASTGLRTGIAKLDGLTSPETRLSGRVVRDTGGLTIQAFRLGNPVLTLTADGHQGRQATDVAATLTLADVAHVTPEAKGALAATLAVKGNGGPLDIAARLAGERLVLKGNSLEGLGVDLAGRLDGGAFDGRISGNGRLKGKPLTLKAALQSGADGARRLEGLELTVADTRVSGDVAQAAGGLMTGRLVATSPDLSALAPLTLVDVAGRLDADVRLTADKGRQQATADVKAVNLALAGNRVAAATLKATVADLLGTPKIDGNFDVKGVTSPAASVASLSGTAHSDGSATAFDVRAGGIAAPQLTAAGLTGFDLTASGRLADRTVTLASARLTGPSGFGAEAKGSVPLAGNGLAVDVTADLPLALAQRFTAERGTRLTGSAKAAIRVGGSLAAPDLSGRVTVAGASVIDPLTTMRLDAVNLALTLKGTDVRIETATASLKGGGSLSAAGSVGLGGSQPVDLRLSAVKARVTDGQIVTADVGASLTVSGALSSGLVVAGKVDIARAEITVPDAGAAGGALLDVKHRDAPAAVNATLKRIDKATGGKRGAAGSALPVSLDVVVEAPRQLFVRGRGIDAELGGRLTVKGALADLRPVGSFKLICGRIVVIGQRISLDEGTVTLQGDLNPYVSLSATSKSDAIAVTASVVGLASDPAIELTSTPELPQDEILARFLFKRSVGDLSALQIAQLAEAVTQLAGGGRGNGIIDSLRAHVGLDDLDVTTDSKGNAAVKAGRYVSERVYVGVTAGAAGQSGVSVNLDITDDVKAKAEATQQQSKVGVYFEKEY